MASLDSGEVLDQLVYLHWDNKTMESGYRLTRDGEQLAECIWKYLQNKSAEPTKESKDGQ